MAKQIVFSDEVRLALKRGIDILAEAVRVTLGPRGHCVALDKKWGAPSVIDDGVTIAKDIELPDPFENMGAQLVRRRRPRPMMPVAMAPLPPPFWLMPLLARGLRTWLPEPTLWC